MHVSTIYFGNVHKILFDNYVQNCVLLSTLFCYFILIEMYFFLYVPHCKTKSPIWQSAYLYMGSIFDLSHFILCTVDYVNCEHLGFPT